MRTGGDIYQAINTIVVLTGYDSYASYSDYRTDRLMRFSVLLGCEGNGISSPMRCMSVRPARSAILSLRVKLEGLITYA